MCGIVGYLGTESGKSFLLSGLKLLQNRGYDSAGVSYINTNIKTIKYASTIDNDSIIRIENEIQDFTCAIGHTRWATHGNKTDINAHPHHDNQNRISLVHNGIIENYHELKENLSGYFFRSKTDTEVIAVMIGKFLDDGFSVKESIEKTVQLLKGTWALVIIHRDFPNKIWITRNGSPLLLGIEEDYIMIVSEAIAFHNYIQKYISLDNHDLIEIDNSNTCLLYTSPSPRD